MSVSCEVIKLALLKLTIGVAIAVLPNAIIMNKKIDFMVIYLIG